MRTSIRSSARTGAAALLIPLALGAGVARADQVVCSVGGTPAARTGIFTTTPGLTLTPSSVPVHLTATGALEGDDPACYGTITLDGTLPAGASCFGFSEGGDVRFFDENGDPVDRGIDTFAGGGTAYSRSLMFSPDGELKATMDAFARSADMIPFTESCNSADGLTEGTFSSVVGLVFLE